MMIETTEKFIRPDARPLYIQVKEILKKRIHSGAWPPGQTLPSEMRLASDLGVSQGTVRKALDALADASIVERKQGRGTFVIEHTSSQVLFKFFHIYDTDGKRVMPGAGETRFSLIKASSDVANSLLISKNTEIFRINRVRTYKGNPLVVEAIYLPKRFFQGLHEQRELPITLYDMFQRDYGITVSRVEENLTAVLASINQAKALKVTAGVPLLKIDRIAYDIEDAPVERRISFYRMNGLKYRANLK